MKDTNIFILTTELMIVNALNLIDQQRSDLRQVCILMGRVANIRYQTKLSQLNIFDSIFLIDYEPPRIKFWIRDTNTRKNFTLAEVIHRHLFPNNLKTIKKHLLLKFKTLIPHLKNTLNIYFHNYNDFTKSIIEFCSPDTNLHLLEEGIASYLRTTIPIEKVTNIHLYDISLAIYKNSENATKFVPLRIIDHTRVILISQLKFLFPPSDKSLSEKIFLDQPIGYRPPLLKLLISSHYRRKNTAFKTKLNLITSLLNQHKDISVRRHPRSNLPTNFKSSELDSNPIPFEFELIHSSRTFFELYSLYSSAACYWRLMFSDEVLNHKQIIVHILYPSLKFSLPDEKYSGIDNLVIDFFERLAAKYPKSFLLE